MNTRPQKTEPKPNLSSLGVVCAAYTRAPGRAELPDWYERWIETELKGIRYENFTKDAFPPPRKTML